MVKYEIASVEYYSTPGDWASLRCTNPETYKELLNRLMALEPRLRVEYGTEFGSSFKGKHVSQGAIYWHIVVLLCDLGWEPFSTNTTDRMTTFHFRRIKQESES